MRISTAELGSQPEIEQLLSKFNREVRTTSATYPIQGTASYIRLTIWFG